MHRLVTRTTFFAMIPIALLLLATLAAAQPKGKPVSAAIQLARGGKALLPIVAGSAKEPVEQLRHYLKQITGGEFRLAEGPQKDGAIYVGLFADFPSMKEYADRHELGSEGFWIIARENSNSVYVLAKHPLGVQHGVTTLLHELGCRWFFPGDVWEVIPQQKDLRVASRASASTPDFPTQRRIWYGFGAYGPCREDWEAWVRHNRMDGPLSVAIGHTWNGLNPDKDFEKHPEWFALVDGKRQATKPCYSHPEVVRGAIETALDRAARGDKMISMTPPDGLGYCECAQCKKAAGVEEVFKQHSSLFGRRKDGTLVNVTSETVFALANRVAKALEEKHPDVLVGCYAYSAYSHPPSFKLHANVYLQTTTAYRRTPLTLQEQLAQFGEKTDQLGIREYYSVYQWDWDFPDPGKMTPGQLQTDLQFFHRSGVTAVNAEASNNWAARGLGYYVAAQLMWDVKADTKAIVADFYDSAFGPAAKKMERYYVRWYGPTAAVTLAGDELPEKQTFRDGKKYNVEALKAAYRDLDEAAQLVAKNDGQRARVDHLRMYMHYLVLREKLQQATASGDKDAIREAIKQETIFGGRLTYTNMLHTRPLIGKAFLRRFRQYEPLLADVPETEIQTWRQIGEAPDREELDRLWQQDKAYLGI